MEKVKSYAKVNLLLKVINKRSDGYQNLQMINKRINLFDEILIEYSDTDLVEFSQDIDTSLMYKVLNKLKDIYNIEKCFHIYIKKNIPLGAGLGGASVNSATIIDTILKMENIFDTLENKINNFKNLGADIPYGFVESDAIVEGTGELIYILNEKINKPLVLVNPHIFISTKEVFTNNLKYSKSHTHEFIINNLENDALYENDLEDSTFKLCNELSNIKQSLAKYGKVVMSGTGSTLIVHSSDVEKIKEEYPDYLVLKIS